VSSGGGVTANASEDELRIGRIILAATDGVQSDDQVTAYAGMGGQGVLPIPLVYNGWVQNLPTPWKRLLTSKQLNPIAPTK
jgi:hypothetical protein